MAKDGTVITTDLEGYPDPNLEGEKSDEKMGVTFIGESASPKHE